LTRIANDAGVSPPPRLSAEAQEHLTRYTFPGNVRELENLLHRAVTLSDSETIECEDLGLNDEDFTDTEWQGLDPLADSGQAAPPTEAPAVAALPRDLVGHLDAVERDIITRALALHRNNRTAAGSSLGLSLRQMRYRMARLGIQVGDHGTD
ncbi:MAG: sigma-54-dependent Fis family transcriptional regulator, partial [Burkholderiales bacterium PBB5]